MRLHKTKRQHKAGRYDTVGGTYTESDVGPGPHYLPGGFRSNEMSPFSFHRSRYLRPKAKKIAARLAIAFLIAASLPALLRADPLLTRDAAALLFSCRENEEGRSFSPTSVTVVEGAFTAPARTEAVISFADTSQSHAAGAAEIWLLRLEGDDWEPIFKIAECDTAEFFTTDLNGDGALELLTHTTRQNQGYCIIGWRLFHFADGNPADLLTFEGFDNTGWPDKGICVFDARFAFRDVNKDAILEVELTEFYDYCMKEDGASVFLRRSERTTVFRPVISRSGSVVGIQRLR